MTARKISAGVKIGFGAGDLAAGLAFQTVGFHFLFFLNNVLGLPAYLAGMVLLIGKAWDGVTDPIMGALVDRTTSKLGAHRFWLAVSILPFALSFAALWLPVGQDVAVRFAVAVALFLLFNTFFTAYNIPYGSMTADLSGDYHERTSLTAVRMVFALLATIIGAGATEFIVSGFSLTPGTKDAAGFTAMGLIFGAIMLVGGITAVLSTRGRDKVIDKAHKTGLADFVGVLKNRPFLILLAAFFFFSLATSGVSSIFIYFVNYNLGLSGLDGSLIMAVLIVAAIAALPLWVLVSKRAGKRAALIAGFVLFMAALVAASMIGLSLGSAVLYAVVAAAGIGLSVNYVILWSLVPDVVEYGELAIGKRQPGLYYGVWFFTQKLGMAVAFQLNGLILSLSGFKESEAGIGQTQSAGALGGIAALMGWVPSIFIVVGMVIMLFYPITAKMHAEIVEKLKSHHG